MTTSTRMKTLQRRLKELKKQQKTTEKLIAHTGVLIDEERKYLETRIKKRGIYKQRAPVYISHTVYTMWCEKKSMMSPWKIGAQMPATVVQAVKNKESGTYTATEIGMVVTVVNGVIKKVI